MNKGIQEKVKIELNEAEVNEVKENEVNKFSKITESNIYEEFGGNISEI